MEKEESNIPRTMKPPEVEAEFLLRWGSRKRLRCVRLRGYNNPADVSSSSTIRRRFLSFSHNSEAPFSEQNRNSEMASVGGITRVDAGAGKQGGDDHEINHDHGEKNINGDVMPKVCIGLSSKEKEEDFMAMNGCKLPHRPKKRPKFVQRTLLLGSPGAWLTDMSVERYQVREKKTTCKKKASGLKAMRSIVDSDSE